MSKENVESTYSRCGKLLEMFVANRLKEIQLGPGDIGLAAGLKASGMNDADIAPDAVFINSVTPDGLKMIEDVKARNPWRRLFRSGRYVFYFALGIAFRELILIGTDALKKYLGL